MKIKRYQPEHLNKEEKRRCFPTTPLLVYLLIVVVMSTGVSFSRYSTSSSGFDTSRVAKFDVEMVSTTGAVTLDGSNVTGDKVEGSYFFTVTSDSEVAVEYDIEIEFAEAPPVGVSLQIDEQDKQSAGGEKTVFRFEGKQIASNDTLGQRHELRIVGDLDTLCTDFNDTVFVRVVAVQVD